jgi:hypothetical protein
VSRDGERVIELLNELGSRVGSLVSEMVPPAAQVHLLNAQRELITALVLIYENRVTTGSGRQTRRGGRASGASTARRAPRRVRKIPVD